MSTPGDPAEVSRLNIAKRRLLDLLDEQLAVVKTEAIARLGEGYHRGDTRNIDPHVTGLALRQLTQSGTIFTELPVRRAVGPESPRSNRPISANALPQSGPPPAANACSTPATSAGLREPAAHHTV